MIPCATVRYLLTQETNYGLGQGHSENPSGVRKRNGEYSDPSLEQGAETPSPSVAVALDFGLADDQSA